MEMTSNGQREIQVVEGMRGGKGQVKIERLLGEKELDGKCGMYARVTVTPGSSLGYHEHHGESETYFFLSGEGVYNDNGILLPVHAGDCTYTGDGYGHGLENTGADDLVLMALIIFGKEK